ncbi:phage baseplate assembly protein V [Pseudomonas asiatica]|uniref:Phage baseplate assembly protein V n=1 Tax=Pseudomonas asiatica TaxID=2219225 RepID=A0A9X4D6U2_9PSED|nr:phage baseplate assembly protein V [Pseudomonas asiatica]MDD2109302.1 phage baseplate assembly protein V [Pseudomonas asiatica]
MNDMLRDLGSRVMMMFSRGVLRSVNDAGPRQQVQVELLKNELRDGLEHMQNYGFTSHPRGGDCAVAFTGGNREQGIVLLIDDRRYRIPLLAGEVAIYDDLGNKVELLREMVKITAVQHVEVAAPTIKLVGDLEVVGNINTTGTITNNGKNIGSTHQHGGVTGGSGNSGAPV